MAYAPSPFQQSIYDFAQQNYTNISDPKLTKSSLIIEAVAGSGKTYTITQLTNFIQLPPFTKGLFLAFNKAIATELQSKLPQNWTASTFHSYGFSLLRQKIKEKIKVHQGKTISILKEMDVPTSQRYAIKQLVGYAKTYGLGYFTHIAAINSWQDILNTHDIDLPDSMSEDSLIALAQTALTKSNADFTTIDFDDMLYLPLILMKEHNLKFKQEAIVIIDEAQDTSGIQIELLKKVTSTIIAVGDTHQAIYAFRGATHTSMSLIQEAFNCIEFPLSISYRCPTKIGSLAQKEVPYFEVAEAAREGSITHLSKEDFNPLNDFTNTLLISRTNKALIEVALTRLHNKKPFTLMSAFPQQLIQYVKSMNASSIADFKVKLQRKVERAIETFTKKGLHNRIHLEQERMETLLFLSQDLTLTDELTNLLEQLMLQKDYNGLTISTIHKAKGLEAENVIIYASELLPAPWVLKHEDPNEIQQEWNLWYVAVTRAQKTLTFIDTSN